MPKINSFKKSCLALAISQVFVAGQTNAASIVVNSRSDTPSPGSCTLRQALRSAEKDVISGSCVRGSGSDEISFDPAIFPIGQTTFILLKGAPLVIDNVMGSSITLTGHGSLGQGAILGPMNSNKTGRLSSYRCAIAKP